MNILTPQEFQELYRELPRSMREVYSSEETTNIIEVISSRNGVAERTSEIVSVVGYLILGAISKEEFSQILEIELGISGNIVHNITQEIVETIIQPAESKDRDIYVLNDLLGEREKEDAGSVAIHPEVRGIASARKALSTPPTPPPVPSTPPANLPGAEMPQTIAPAPPTQTPVSAYPVPPALTSSKTGPSDDTSEDIKIPENIFEAKLRQVSQSLEEEAPSKPPTPPKPSADPYREPVE